MSDLEAEWITKPGSKYRWNVNRDWLKWEDMCDFDSGDAITIDPFVDSRKCATQSFLGPVFGTFIEYVTEDIAKVHIPPEDTDSRSWFDGDGGDYLIHEGYLTPQ